MRKGHSYSRIVRLLASCVCTRVCSQYSRTWLLLTLGTVSLLGLLSPWDSPGKCRSRRPVPPPGSSPPGIETYVSCGPDLSSSAGHHGHHVPCAVSVGTRYFLGLAQSTASQAEHLGRAVCQKKRHLVTHPDKLSWPHVLFSSKATP